MELMIKDNAIEASAENHYFGDQQHKCFFKARLLRQLFIYQQGINIMRQY